MKTMGIERATLERCVEESADDRVLVTRGGRPVALIVGVNGLDREQVELGSSDKFWKLIRERRKEKTISRAELERQLGLKRRRQTKG